MIEIDEASGVGKLIVQGHSSGEVWGLSCHPAKDLFVTACDDKVFNLYFCLYLLILKNLKHSHYILQTVRVWSSQHRRMIGMRKVNGEARSVAFNHDGSLIAVGCLNGSVSTNTRLFCLFLFLLYIFLKELLPSSLLMDILQLSVVESETLKEVFSTTIRKEEISEVKFSPDGKFLAMGSHDNFIGMPHYLP